MLWFAIPSIPGFCWHLLAQQWRVGEWRGLLASALIFGALWRKLRLEEKWMRVQFGEPYEAYSRQVAALVPYIM